MWQSRNLQPMWKKLSLLMLLMGYGLSAQELGAWDDLYSYNRVDDVVQTSDDKYLCAAGHALFLFDYGSKEVSKFSKANGLNDIRVTAIERDPQSGTVVVGYANANIDLLRNNNVINVADIVNSDKFPGARRINEIVIRNGIAYLATGFGVVELELDRRIILDTWIIGDNSSELEVFDVEFDDTRNRVWAATADGLYYADLNDPLYYFESWQKDANAPESTEGFVEKVGDNLFAVLQGQTNDTLYRLDAGSSQWVPAPDPSVGQVNQLLEQNGKLMVSFTYTAEERSPTGEIDNLISPGYGNNTGFRPLYAMKDPTGKWFIGDEYRGLIYIDNPSYVQRARPASPPSNNVETVYIGRDGLYIAPGGVTGIFAPRFFYEGFYRMADMAWTHFGVGKTDTAHDIIQILDDPIDPTRFFVAAFGTGILEFRNGVLHETWNQVTTNDVLQGTLNANDVRTGGMAFDSEGTLWVTTSTSATSLASYNREGEWQAYSLGSINGRDMKNIRVLENGDFWIQGRNDGLYAVRIVDGTVSTRRLGTGEGNGDLSSAFIHDFEEDLDGEVWIGTGEGVMVHYSPGNLFEPNRNIDASNILVLEEGVYQRLLGSEGVLAVEVDGANRKWFGTESGGVFLTSEDGLDEIHHFTTTNSPLPSNRVVDIQVDPDDGTVYIATDVGVVTFNGDATAGVDEMDEITVYPNPVRPGYTGPIAIRGLVENAQVKITDVAGNLVYETVANGGQAVWYGENLSGDRAVTGVYLAYVTDDLGENTTVVKILLVNGQ